MFYFVTLGIPSLILFFALLSRFILIVLPGRYWERFPSWITTDQHKSVVYLPFVSIFGIHAMVLTVMIISLVIKSYGEN